MQMRSFMLTTFFFCVVAIIACNVTSFQSNEYRWLMHGEQLMCWLIMLVSIILLLVFKLLILTFLSISTDTVLFRNNTGWLVDENENIPMAGGY